MDLNGNLIKAFLAVAEHRTFSAAAVAIQKSQSGVSTQIAQLEAQLGITLFDRRKRPLELTEAGTILLRFAKTLNNSVRDLQRSLNDLEVGTAGDVRIGATNSITSYLLPTILVRLLRKYPRITISVITNITPRLFDLVRDAEVDFAVAISNDIPNDLSAKPLLEEPLCFVMSARHSLAHRNNISAEQLRSVPFVAGLSGSMTIVQRALDDAGISPNAIALRLGTYESVKRVLCEGFGISLLPEFAVKDDIKSNKLVSLRHADTSLKVRVQLLERLQSPKTRAVTKVKEFIETQLSARNRGKRGVSDPQSMPL